MAAQTPQEQAQARQRDGGGRKATDADVPLEQRTLAAPKPKGNFSPFITMAEAPKLSVGKPPAAKAAAAASAAAAAAAARPAQPSASMLRERIAARNHKQRPVTPKIPPRTPGSGSSARSRTSMKASRGSTAPPSASASPRLTLALGRAASAGADRVLASRGPLASRPRVSEPGASREPYSELPLEPSRPYLC
jgi:hypothetical protein